jgi:hypothetical protein
MWRLYLRRYWNRICQPVRNTTFILFNLCFDSSLCLPLSFKTTGLIFNHLFVRSSGLSLTVLEHTDWFAVGFLYGILVFPFPFGNTKTLLSFSRIIRCPYTPSNWFHSCCHCIKRATVFTQSPNTLCHFTTPISSFNSTGRTASTLNCIFLSNLCVWYHFRLSFCSQHPLTLKRAQNLFPTAISRNATCISDSCFNAHYLTVIVHVFISVFERV